MTTREAALRLRWDQASFSSQVRASAGDMKRQFEGAARGIGETVKRSFGAGFDGARRSLAGMAGGLRRTLAGPLAQLGAGLSMGEFVRRAVDAEEQAGAVAAQLRRVGEQGAQTGDVLAFSVGQAQRLSLVTSEVTAAYAALLDETGDPVFSRESLDSVAQFRHAFRLAAGDSANLVGALKDGLDVSVEQLRADFGPAIRDAISQGGMNAEQIAQMAPRIVKAMTTIGSQGGQGFVELVGLINMTEGALGGVEAAVPSVEKLLLALRTPNLKKMGQQLGVRFEPGASSVENLQKIIATKGGVEALEKAFGKSARTAGGFRALMMKFEEAQQEAVERGAKPAKAREEAALAFAAELERMTRVTSTTADVEADAAARLEEKGERLRLAVDRMAAAFTKPQILDALDKLAASLPPLADGFGRLVSFVAENPGTVAAGAVGGKVLLDAVGAALVAAFSRGPAAAVAAASREVAVMNVGVLNVGGGPSPTVPGPGGAKAPPVMRAGRLAPAGAVGAAGAGALVVGGLLAGAVGFLAGDQIRQATIDPEQRRQVDALTSGADAALANAGSAMQSRSVLRKREALEALRRSREEVEGTRGGVTDFLNTVGAVFGGAKEPEQLRREKLAALAESEARLSAQIEQRLAVEHRLARASAETAKELERAGKAARGVRRPADPLPGDARTGG